MSQNNDKFIDPIDAIIARHEAAGAMDVPKTEETSDSSYEPVTSLPADIPETIIPVENNDEVSIDSSQDEQYFSDLYDDDIYGDGDNDRDIAAEEALAEQDRLRAAQEMEAMIADNKKAAMPPLSLDPVFQEQAIGFQTEKMAIVTTMVNKVIAKHHIVSGGIPEKKKMQIMGELIDQYHRNGEVITPEFEHLILDNWEGGTVALEESENTSQVDDQNTSQTEESERPTPVININVEPNTPVNINVDDSIIAEQSKNRVINIHVHEVSNEELRASTIIENTMMEGIIEPYNSDMTDLPIALPMSAYRCRIRGLNMFEMFTLNSLNSGNESDAQLKIWQMIYEHIKNPSIGAFANYEDFLKKTDFRDQSTLLWGMFVATADEEEVVPVHCGNDKCKNPIEIHYIPREMVRIDEENIPDYYTDVQNASVGKDAIEIYNRAHSKHKLYELPESKYLVEVGAMSAYEYITDKLPIERELHLRYRPDDVDLKEQLSPEEEQNVAIMLMYLRSIKSITINKNGKSYKFTNWRDLEKIISTSLGNNDLMILINIVQRISVMSSPLHYEIEVGHCPKCGFNHIPMSGEQVIQQLFFQVSQRFTNIEIDFDDLLQK